VPHGSSAVPPKITPPLCRDIFPRRRLYELLDGLRDRAALWISGPPGSGKTALVCSYLNQEPRTCIWYQVDAEDDDPATFFYYLARATALATGTTSRVPPFTGEYFESPINFTRWYLTLLCASLPLPAVFVLDNYQEVAEDSALQPIVHTIIDSLPPAMQLIIISRNRLPPFLSREKLNGRLATLGWDDLRLTLEESGGILSKRAEVSRERIALLHEKAAGWVAGLLLLEAGMEMGSTSELRVDHGAKEELFHYFAGEIFDRLGDRTRDFLLRTAMLPHMTIAMAGELSGVRGGTEILLGLTRRNYFVSRRPAPKSIYQYHPMFREFLLAQAQRLLPDSERKLLAARAGLLLLRAGDTEEAAMLFIQAERWSDLIGLVMENAAMLHAEGRLRLLMDWLMKIPEEIRTRTPWLLYWLGICRIFLDPVHSMPLLEQAYHRFTDSRDSTGMLLAWAGIINAILLRSGSFSPFAQWIDEFRHLEPLLDRQPLQVRAPVIVAMLYALGLASTDTEKFENWVQRGEWLVQQDIDVVSKAHTFNLLIVKALFRGDLAGARYYLSLFRTADRSESLPPFSRIQLKNCAASFAWLSGRFEECEAEAHEGLEIADYSGIGIYTHYFWGQLAAGALSEDRMAAAEGYLREMEKCKDRLRPWEQSFFHVLSIWAALLADDVARALLHAETAVRLIDSMGTTVNNAHIYLGQALALSRDNRKEEAGEMLRVALEVAGQARDRQIEFICLLAGAWLSLQRQEEQEADACLRKALELGRIKGYVNGYFWSNDMMARLCCRALEQGIEEEYVRRLIRRRNLLPPSPPTLLENWPWKIRIYSLGRFSLLVDDRPVHFTRKAKSRPLALLHALLALGGRNVSQDKLCECLWPDALGDAALSALSTTVQRLRKVLTVHEALIVRNNTLTLNPRLCWVDVWAFERFVSLILSGTLDEQKILFLDRALSLYHGPFLRELEAEYWTRPLRDRIAKNFSWLVTCMADVQQDELSCRHGCRCLEKALLVAPVDEALYRRLMECHAAYGRMDQVRQTYENCCRALADHGGGKPSGKTKELFESLLQHPTDSRTTGS